MTVTHCPYCALQCGMTVTRTAEAPPRISERDFPTNRGGMCQKGWTSAELLTSSARLTTPLARDSRNEPLHPVSWDAAPSSRRGGPA